MSGANERTNQLILLLMACRMAGAYRIIWCVKWKKPQTSRSWNVSKGISPPPPVRAMVKHWLCISWSARSQVGTFPTVWQLPPFHDFDLGKKYKNVTNIQQWSELFALYWAALGLSGVYKSTLKVAPKPILVRRACSHGRRLRYLFKFQFCVRVTFLHITRVLEGLLLTSVSVMVQNRWFPFIFFLSAARAINAVKCRIEYRTLQQKLFHVFT